MRDLGWLMPALAGTAVIVSAPHATAQEIELTACVGAASRCFDVLSVSFGIANSGGLVVGGGGGAGRPTFDPVAITKAPDGHTPDLAGFATQATRLPEASIEFTAVGAAAGSALLTVELENVLVTKDSIAVGPDGSPVELIELDYQQITLTAGTATFCWDRVLQRRCS